ncbi:MAG: hypothetical protein Q9M92_06120 [Enterobacterales bacterium]|nr:hypothetical protein [Enterobacterales bacterium]
MVSAFFGNDFCPGGTGTEWEIFQTIEQMKSGQLAPVPMYIAGDKKFIGRVYIIDSTT